MADGRLGCPIIPIQPYWLVSCREDGRKLWAGARVILTVSRLEAFHKYVACCVSLCSPFMLRALIIKTYNLHNITKESPFVLFSLFILLRLLLLLLLQIILIIYVFLLATLPCFLSLSFHIGHNPKEKLILKPKGEIFSECLLQCQQMTRITLEIYLFSFCLVNNAAACIHVTAEKVEEQDVSFFWQLGNVCL